MGPIESGLAVTTINPGYTSEEIGRQLLSCQPKAIICLVSNYNVVKNACVLAQQLNTKIIAIKTDSSIPFPDDAINFFELMNCEGKFIIVNTMYLIHEGDL